LVVQGCNKATETNIRSPPFVSKVIENGQKPRLKCILEHVLKLGRSTELQNIGKEIRTQ
jgi:hypothetical protein